MILTDKRLIAEADERLEAARKAAGPDISSLKSFRYFVSSVNEEALKVWEDLWKEFQAGVTPAGSGGPHIEGGFQPSCGWSQFLEKFWVLKHYLDTTSHFCRDSGGT